MLTKDESFDACHISMTRVSAPNSLKVVIITNISFKSNWNISLEVRHMSLRYDKHQKFGLNGIVAYLGNS